MTDMPKLNYLSKRGETYYIRRRVPDELKGTLEGIEEGMHVEMDKWMIRESDFLPLPSHVQALENR